MPKFKGNPQDIVNDVLECLEKSIDKEVHVLISKKETKEMRTLTQNSMLHGLFIEISNHLGEDVDAVKNYFLIGCFGSRKVKLSKIEVEVPIESHTSKLKKEQAIFFIDTLMKFIEVHGVPCKYTSRELQSLYDTF